MAEKINPFFGWILRDHPTFWEDNGFEQIDNSKYHYFGLSIPKGNHCPVYRKELYVNYDYEEEAEVVVFPYEKSPVTHSYIMAIYEWNNAGDTGCPLKQVSHIQTIDEYNKIIEDWGLDALEDGSFLLEINN